MHIKEIDKLKTWFLNQSRDLPWRGDGAFPYAVWVSEVMLQQTQAAVVVPYFERWMKRFPTIVDLAKAPQEQVLKEWEGLGYYARARNLHEGAKYVVQHHHGQLPSDPNELRKIKGLGDYTIGAIMSFAFHQRMAAVDGNVFRVLARYYGIQEDIAKAGVVKKIREMAQNLLPEEAPWIIAEGLIELGATLCGRKPKCMQCPLKTHCRAHQEGMQEQLPIKTKKQKTEILYRHVAIVKSGDHLMVGKVVEGNVMAGLYEFPYLEMKDPKIDVGAFQEQLMNQWKISLKFQAELPSVSHSFTRFRAHLFPVVFTIKKQKKFDHYEWMTIDSLKEVAFSSGHRRILAIIQQNSPQSHRDHRGGRRQGEYIHEAGRPTDLKAHSDEGAVG